MTSTLPRSATPARATAASATGPGDPAQGVEGHGVGGPVLIAPMRRRHLRGVLAIEQVTNERPWSLGLFLGELRMPTSRSYLVALDRHLVVGFCGLMVTGDDGHITNVAMHPDHRRRGIATRLMLQTMHEARGRGVTDVTLEVRASNDSAQAMYRRFGFAPEGVRRNYYAEVGEDAIIMWARGVDSDDYSDRLERILAAHIEASKEMDR